MNELTSAKGLLKYLQYSKNKHQQVLVKIISYKILTNKKSEILHMKCLWIPLDILIKRENALNGCRTTMNLGDMHLQTRVCDEQVPAYYTDK